MPELIQTLRFYDESNSVFHFLFCLQDDDWSDRDRSRSGSVKSNQSAASKQSSKAPSIKSKDSLFAEEPDDSAATKPKSNRLDIWGSLVVILFWQSFACF